MACERVRVRVRVCACWGRAAWCARGRRATWLMVLLVVPLVFRVPSGPAAREIATREPTARSGRSRSPPVPSGPSGTLHNSGAWWLIGGWARRLEARPGLAAAQVSCPDLTCGIAETAPNFARNSPATISNIEFRSLELQRFLTLLKLCSIELRATFWGPP